ncbi:MAG TPA: hypothetical protein VJ419_04590 [Gaiellaceae bacterium]|nr:hypothetical protein [Gaiellaceae bacterium]
MADQPDGIVLRRHRDLQGRRWHPWLRRGLLGLIALVLVLALFDVFGQETSTTRAEAGAATLSVSAPGAVRGGLLFQARITTEVHTDLRDATLVLNQAWVDGLTVNTIEPSPLNEASRDGNLAFDLGHLPAGSKHVLYLDYQVNPTTVGSRTLRLELQDGETPVTSLERTLRILP